MKLSERIIGLNGAPGESDGWGVYYRARAMIEAGETLTMLCIGEHDRKTAPFILDAMDASARGGNTGYALALGQDGLRRAVAERVEAATGVDTTAANVMITTGGQAALFATMCAALDPGDTAVIVDPYYATYPSTVRGAGGVLRTVAARPSKGFQPDASDLSAATEGARALLINTPHNPTGAVYSRATMEGIAAVCRERDLWLISDEVYSGQVHEGAHLSPRALPGMAERTLVVGSMSKSYVMTGFRIGWVIGPEDVIAAMMSLANATTYGVPGFIQDAAEIALRQGAAEEAEVAALYNRRRDRAVAALEGSPVAVSPPDGAMYVMLDIRGTGMSGEAFAMALLERERIAVMPGESFGRAAAGHVRVALTVGDEAMAAALRRLAQFASRLAKAA
ncbi:pyridoxal phosphate-dependent aminotransferase [Pikeienuella piscinae]|uniref:Aminotransferase n=1 Tax=Pikeienuella piscinae TaxID=2748098 RepID=A0A7L5BSI8_9RHOB|nr:pyridoxal phosphate-dependent aminotransferase [Pikeienuella piscinae]QIE54320.1 pyridoxal phosphate-dependent aminotransferase [Pikeienuella piscinae]